MKRLSLLIVACLAFFSLQAAYLKDIPVTITQPDGSVLHCFASGDEFFNYLHDKEGYTIIQHPVTGFYVYADKIDGKLVPTDFIAGKSDPATKNLTPYNLISATEWTQRRKAWDAPDPRPKNRDGQINHGTLNNIAIFIRFSDDDEFENAYSSIDNMFNDMSGASVSMRSYFQAASYGAIDIPTTFYPGHTGETIISYQDSLPKSYFQPYNATTNPNGYKEDEKKEREFSLLQRAVNYINDNYPIPSDLNIDYDNDGYVDNVCFIVRGDVGGWNSLLWPHKWTLHDRYVYINGKRVYVFNFQLADATSHFKTSTMCHEMNHSLSAPDLYHYENGTGLQPVGSWDLMEVNTTPPQHCGAYMKMKYGHWIDEIPEITEAGTYTLNPISSKKPINIAYKIPTEDPYQFYVLEYRSKTDETAIPGSGLLVYRIDTRFDGNEEYDPDEGIYDEIYIFRPGGTTTANGTIGNAFFSNNSGRTEFSSTTNPQPFFTDGTIDKEIRIYDISSADSTISFKYGTTASCDPPTNLAVTVNGNSAILTWDEATNAQSYNIYRNGNLVANTTSTTYTDSNLLYGVFQYSLRSKDSNDILSTSTKSVLVAIEPIPSRLTVTKEGNNATLTWIEPEWNYPTTPASTLTYGDQTFNNRVGYDNDTIHMYWGHRYPSGALGLYDGNKVYSVSFYACEAGTYTAYIYEGSVTRVRETLSYPESQVTEQSITVTDQGWVEIQLAHPHTVDGSKDLWVFMYDNDAHNYPAAFCSYNGEDGNYVSTDPTTEIYFWANSAFLIKTHLTDGTYTYNLYDGTTKVNGDVPITSTNYTVENITNNTAHQFSVKTNYYGGESPASNMVGLTLGSTSVSDMKLKGDDVMTVTSGSTLTVTGTLENQDPSHLIIEDGAQLIHNSTGVKATVEQFVDPYVNLTDKDGWRFIASPVLEAITPSTDNNLLNGTYDLYYYDEPTYYWKNYRNESFNLVPGQGYLYATNAPNDTLQFAGTLTPSNAAVASNTLSFKLNGFNLIGNPFACNANIDRDFYVIDNTTHKIVLAATGRTIAPCEGVIVKATANNQTATFSKAGAKKGDLDNELLDLVVTNGKTTLDRIRVRSGKGPGMEKFSLDSPENTRLFLRQDGQDYAVAHIAGQPSMPVQFKASKDGSYTLSIENNLIDLDYLHLIDHLTGMDIDLLQNPSYSFEAHTDDYAARFQLMFSPKANDDVFGDSFVDGKTVVIDMTGRVVATDRNTQLAPGVYIVRTVNGNETNNKKIIINK